MRETRGPGDLQRWVERLMRATRCAPNVTRMYLRLLQEGDEMSVWGRVFAGIYDHMMARTERAGLGAHRQALVATASGDVLEIGAGTGTNLAYYDDQTVKTLTFTEP